MDPVADARDVVRDRFPGALAAFLGGSVLTAQRTSTSDLDVVVVVRGPPAPCRESLVWRGWPVELFVHDEQTLADWFGRDSARRRPTLARMCAEGAILVAAADDGLVSRVRGQAAAVLAAGPPPLDQAELDLRRYGLSDLLDDLAGSTDPGETFVICWNVLVLTAELALLESGRWLGSGKWLLRELRALDPGFADQLISAREDPALLTRLAGEVLGRTGGRLWDGYRAAGNPDENRLGQYGADGR